MCERESERERERERERVLSLNAAYVGRRCVCGQVLPDKVLLTTSIGVLSSIIDNVPLVAATQVPHPIPSDISHLISSHPVVAGRHDRAI